LIIVLSVQKLTHRGVSDKDYNFRYPFGEEYGVTVIDEKAIESAKKSDYELIRKGIENGLFATTKTVKRTKRGKYDKPLLYIAILLAPLYLWGAYVVVNNYQQSRLAKEYPASWGESIAVCDTKYHTSIVGSVDTRPIDIKNCKCENTIKSMYAINPFEYSEKYGANMPAGYDSQHQECMEK